MGSVASAKLAGRLILPTLTQRASFSQPFFAAPKAGNVGKSLKKKDVQSRFSKQIGLRLSDYLRLLSNPEIEAHLSPLRNVVSKQGAVVRNLKDSGANKSELDQAINKLKILKKELENKELELAPKEASFDRIMLEDLLTRRFIYDQSFSIYGGVAGLYDFGPIGSSLLLNLANVWRKHFVSMKDRVNEITCTSLTPERVLRASGHVERFADWMVKDMKNGECFRADHIIKNSAEELIENKRTSDEDKNALQDVLAKLDGFNDNDMNHVIRKFKMKSPVTGNDLSEPIAFNLMFPSQIGPTGDLKAFLRPETAQGIFVNFKRLLEFNQGKLPFGVAQVGYGFRNEIAPKQGLIRNREFLMCELEHFVDPADKTHPKFYTLASCIVSLLPASNQDALSPAISMTIGEAVEKNIIANEMLGYYLARCQVYLTAVGIDPRRLRFRQHLANEMAHYAQDCWDAEVLTSYGWIECVGNADRSCYDLIQHSNSTNIKLVAQRKLSEPKVVNSLEVLPKMSSLIKIFSKNAKRIQQKLTDFSDDDAQSLKMALDTNGFYELTVDGEIFELKPHMLSIKQCSKKVYVEEITPSVIEPSYGMGRIMYAVLEHSFRQRDGDEQRTFVALPALIAPIKCTVLPLSSNEKLASVVEAVEKELDNFDFDYHVDDSSGSIGKRYARNDEIGIPYGITVDYESVDQPMTVTLRHTESMEQIRLQVSDVGRVVDDLCRARRNWSDITRMYPKFVASKH